MAQTAQVWDRVRGAAGELAVHTANGNSTGPSTGVVVLLHGFPLDTSGEAGRTFPALADRVAAESGWSVVTACLRGVTPSEGDFSLAGWFEDIGTLVDHAFDLAQGNGIRLVGFGTSGSLALCRGAGDLRIGGVACLGSSSSFAEWATDLQGMLDFARNVGVIKTPGFPTDPGSWGAEFGSFHPLGSIARVAPRPVLIVHGTADEGVPVSDARELAEAGGPGAELRLVVGAGHQLRADPRAVALLVGWLERQVG